MTGLPEAMQMEFARQVGITHHRMLEGSPTLLQVCMLLCRGGGLAGGWQIPRGLKSICLSFILAHSKKCFFFCKVTQHERLGSFLPTFFFFFFFFCSAKKKNGTAKSSLKQKDLCAINENNFTYPTVLLFSILILILPYVTLRLQYHSKKQKLQKHFQQKKYF